MNRSRRVGAAQLAGSARALKLEAEYAVNNHPSPAIYSDES